MEKIIRDFLCHPKKKSLFFETTIKRQQKKQLRLIIKKRVRILKALILVHSFDIAIMMMTACNRFYFIAGRM